MSDPQIPAYAIRRRISPLPGSGMGISSSVICILPWIVRAFMWTSFHRCAEWSSPLGRELRTLVGGWDADRLGRVPSAWVGFLPPGSARDLSGGSLIGLQVAREL